MKVRDLLKKLSGLDLDTEVLLIPAKSSGVSDMPRVRVEDGATSRYGYVLPVSQYRHLGEDTRPVVWIS